MANVSNGERPLSPHLGIWKWGPSMTTSIAHRVTGTGLALVGAVLFVWWLLALSSGEAVYGQFRDIFTYQSGKLNAAGYLVGIGLTLAIFQHIGSGIRHLVTDIGDNFELGANKRSALFTYVFAVLATAAFWFVILEKLA